MGVCGWYVERPLRKKQQLLVLWGFPKQGSPQIIVLVQQATWNPLELLPLKVAEENFKTSDHNLSS